MGNKQIGPVNSFMNHEAHSPEQADDNRHTIKIGHLFSGCNIPEKRDNIFSNKNTFSLRENSFSEKF